ncbi:Sodium/Hydrogen Exchanger 4 [Manis pentadactyla]|nr:Sodium/Hydrogen Exchanger 4 [Manis pentadactyla]
MLATRVCINLEHRRARGRRSEVVGIRELVKRDSSFRARLRKGPSRPPGLPPARWPKSGPAGGRLVRKLREGTGWSLSLGVPRQRLRPTEAE